MKNQIIGQTVTVTVDRPLGSRHPEHPDIFYSVNYGYINGIASADGEAQDAYILGIYRPLHVFTGQITAIIHRRNDVEDKWVVTPKGLFLSIDDIIKQTAFQEKFFDTEIII
ncbi:MAG: inorganic pyrophosphatase [Clostridia bacterium]|nr:inorganic pyrophosphatase [Clostridia bacterium]